MSEHAILSCSGAPRWVECTASIQHCASLPEKPSHPMTLEGEAIHEMCKIVLQDFADHDLKGHTKKRSDFLGKKSSNGTVYTDEMLDVGEKYISEIINLSSQHKGAKLLIEHRVYMPNIHKENWGTLDAAVIFLDTEASLLVLADLKCGWGIVEADENWQLLNYTVGVLNDLHSSSQPLPKNLQLRLIQPRPYHRQGPVRTFNISLEQLTPYFLKLRESAAEALGPNPKFVTGPHCDHCPGRETCPALIKSAYRIVETVKGLQTTNITGKSLGNHLFMLDEALLILKALREALDDKALQEIRQGKSVPGWEWASSESRVNWTSEDENVYQTGDLYGVDLRTKKPITPKQAIAKGVPKEVVDMMSASEKKGIKLVPADLKASAKIFKQPK